MIVLATDSGLERTGYAVFTKNAHDFHLTDFGCIITKKKDSIEQRLLIIHNEFKTIIKKYAPEKIIIEQIFFNTNQKTIVSIAQAQGVVLLLAAQHNIEVIFLSPLTIKQTITGYGRADKKQMEKMIQLLLHLDTMPKPDDVVDAIGVGLSYCSTKNFGRNILS